MNKSVNWYFEKKSQWQECENILRKIVLSIGLTEELKWGCPTYTVNGNNVVLIHRFKNYCALLFMKGVLLDDPKKLLIQQTEHVQVARQIRFTSPEEITTLQNTIRSYIKNAIQVEKSGIKPILKETKEYKIPEELREVFDSDPDLKTSFDALTPGRQRGYFFYIGGAKQTKTRTERATKCIPYILKGRGILKSGKFEE